MTNLWSAQDAGSRQLNVSIPSYISGFLDGEGCFSVVIAPRPKLKIGWEVRPSVSVSQNADRSEVVDVIHSYFGCGSIRPDPSDHTVKWESRSVMDLVHRVLPHFETFPLLSKKQRDVEALDMICQLVIRGDHLNVDGLTQVVELARVMNPSGRRRYDPEAILLDLRTR